MARAQKRNPFNWTKADADAIKQAVRDTLAGFGDDIAAQKDYLLSTIRDYSKSTSGQQHLSCFIHIIAAMVHNIRHNSIPAKTIESIADIAQALLTTHGIDSNSKLAFLASELHVCRSHESQRKGDRFIASFRHELANFYAGGQMSGGDAYYRLLVATHRMRLGQASKARQLFAEAEIGTDNDDWRRYCNINQIRCLRLMGQYNEATTLLGEFLKEAQPHENARLEGEWEQLCANAMAHGDFERLGNAVRHGQSHCHSVYIAEAHLWLKACADPKMATFLPNARNAAASGAMRLADLGHLYRVVMTLNDCYDKQIPAHTNLEKLEEMLAKVHLLNSIDYELLTWAATIRWLKRNDLDSFADLCNAEYARLSLIITDGRSQDCLNFFANDTTQSLVA